MLCKIDSLIRFFLYALIFWLPYSNFAIEFCVITALVLWIIKRLIQFNIERIDQRENISLMKRLVKNFKMPSSPLNLPVFIFLCACLVSVISSELYQQSFQNFLTKTCEWFVVYFLVLEVFTKKNHFKSALIIFFITSLATALNGIYQYHISHKDLFLAHSILPGGRATASFRTANGFGGYLTFAIPISLAYFTANKSILKDKFIGGFIGLIMIWALVVTYSRGAMLGLLMGMLFFLFHVNIVKKNFFLGIA